MAKKQDEKLIINQIIIKAPQRKIVDVGEWRNAMRSADYGRMKRLYDLFDDLLIDGILSDAVGKRKDAVANAELTFQNTKGEEVPEMTALIDTIEFEELLRLILDIRFWGRTGIEFDFTDGLSIYEIPKKHINLNNQTILINDSDEAGISYANDDNILIIGKKRDYGLLLKAAPFVIWKRGGFGDYAQWLEIFGMPQRVGKYSSYDPESRKLLEQALEQAGSAPWIAIPKESEVETTNNTGSGSAGTSYNDFRKACNEELLITILGQTMTTVQGDKGARALGEVHKAVEEGKNKSDMKFVQRVLNQMIVPILEKRGFPVKGGSFVFPEAAEELEVSEIVQLSDIIEIPASYLHNKYSIPMPKDSEQIAKRGSQQVIKQPGDNELEKDPEQEEKENPKKKKKNLFHRFFVHAPTKERGKYGNLRTKLADSENLNDRIISRINGKETFDTELFEYIYELLFSAVTEHLELADTSFVYGAMDDAYKTAMEINLFHFSAAKTIAEIAELNRIFRESKSFNEFYKEASKVVNIFNKTWMQTEYETALLVAEASSNYWRLKSKSHIFPFWQYTAVMDGRTRESHAGLHGVILPSDDKRWEKIMPPNGWKCRCRIKGLMAHEAKGIDFDKERQIVDEYLETAEWKKLEAQGWGVNRAETAEIFTANQLYINKFPENASTYLDRMTAAKWELDTVPNLIKKAETAAPKTTLTAQEIWDKYSDGSEIKMKLFNDRELTLSKKSFDAHTFQKNDDRSELFNAVLDALQNPDELWLANERKIDQEIYKKWIKSGRQDKDIAAKLNYDNFTLIKYYNDYPIVVNYKIIKGKLQLKTWYRLSNSKKVWIQKRSGLFIKQKGSRKAALMRAD